jgi:hypothetical protein
MIVPRNILIPQVKAYSPALVGEKLTVVVLTHGFSSPAKKDGSAILKWLKPPITRRILRVAPIKTLF